MTPQQARVLKFIQSEYARTGDVPTYRKIAEHFGFKAVGTVQDYIRRLVDEGALEKSKTPYGGYSLPHRTASISVPVLGAVPAGRPVESFEQAEGSVVVPAGIPGPLFALRVHGDSMRDRGILSGDYVVVKQQADANSGDIVVSRIGGEATVKTFEKKSGKIRLIPAHPDFYPLEITPQMDYAMVGKVVAVYRDYLKS